MKSLAVRRSPNDEEQLNSSCRTHEIDESFGRLTSVSRQIDDRLFERGVAAYSNADRHISHTHVDGTQYNEPKEQRIGQDFECIDVPTPRRKIRQLVLSRTTPVPITRELITARDHIAEERMILADRPLYENSRKQRPNLFQME